MCPLSGILNGCPRLRPTLVPDSLTSAQRGLIRVVRTRLFEQLRELVKSCPGLGANNTIGHECVSALKCANSRLGHRTEDSILLERKLRLQHFDQNELAREVIRPVLERLGSSGRAGMHLEGTRDLGR